MTSGLLTRASGWLVVVLLVVTIGLPYALRRRCRVLACPLRSQGLFRLHFWIGYSIAGLVLVHAWLSMRPEIAGRTDRRGLYAATGALALAVGQIALGLALRRTPSTNRTILLKIHFAAMVLLVTLTVSHLLVNGSLARAVGTGVGRK